VVQNSMSDPTNEDKWSRIDADVRELSKRVVEVEMKNPENS
jgi:hypothetical protein